MSFFCCAALPDDAGRMTLAAYPLRQQPLLAGDHGHARMQSVSVSPAIGAQIMEMQEIAAARLDGQIEFRKPGTATAITVVQIKKHGLRSLATGGKRPLRTCTLSLK